MTQRKPQRAHQRQRQRQRQSPMDPYTLLNVSHNATEEEIQKSYKHCSRSFHPDKQPPERRESAQEVFVSFKNAYDIVMDPVLRFAYDEYGHYGVFFIRRYLRKQTKKNQQQQQQQQQQSNSSEEEWNRENAVHPVVAMISALLQKGDKDTAYFILTDSMQYHEYKQYEQDHPFYCNMELQCSTLHTQLFGEGMYPNVFPEVEKSSISFLLKIPPADIHSPPPTTTTTTTKNNNNNNDNNTENNGAPQHTSSILSNLEYEMEGSCLVKDGKGHFSGKLGAQYEPTPGTDVRVHIAELFGMDPKLSLTSTRAMSSGTIMTVGAVSSLGLDLSPPSLSESSSQSTLSKPSPPIALSLTTKRVLNQGKIYSIFSIGMGSNRTFHYTQLSLTSLYPNFPRSSLILNLGADSFPLQIRFNHDKRWLSSQFRPSSSTTSATNTESSQSKPKPKPPTLFQMYQNIHKENEFDDDSNPTTGHTSLSIGFNGSIRLKTTLTRKLNAMTNLSLGIQHMTTKGLTFVGGLERGNCSIQIPVWITSSPSFTTMYPMKVLYTCAWTLLLNEALTEVLEYTQLSFLRRGSSRSSSSINDNHHDIQENEIIATVEQEEEEKDEMMLYIEEQLLQLEKAKQDAMEQKQLMIPSAEKKKLLEQQQNGLVILKATYGIDPSSLRTSYEDHAAFQSILQSGGGDNGGDNGDGINDNNHNMESDLQLDVTTQLQFWVVNSKLKLPASSKSNLLGFYNVKHISETWNKHHSNIANTTTKKKNKKSWWRNYFLSGSRHPEDGDGKNNNNNNDDDDDLVTLTVRYQCGDGVYEITIKDEQALTLPCEQALKLGNSQFVS